MAVVRPNPKMDKLVKDSGVLLEGFYQDVIGAESYDDLIDKFLTAMDTPAYLGITRGGNAFSMENETRIVEYDGRRVRSKGDFAVDSASPQITTTLLVHDDTNLRRVYAMSDVQKLPSGANKIKPRLGSPQDSDYMDDVCWVREMTNGDIKINVLFNAINTANPSETGADKSESEMPCIFMANAEKWEDTEYAPCEIITFPREQGVA